MSNLWQINVIQRDGVVRVEQRAVWCSCKSGGDAMQVVVGIGGRWLAATMTAILLQCRKLIREPGMCSSGSWMGSFPLTRSLAAAYCTVQYGEKKLGALGGPPPPSVRCVCPLSSSLALEPPTPESCWVFLERLLQRLGRDARTPLSGPGPVHF